MGAYKRTLKGIRADRGGLSQTAVAKELSMNQSVYNAIEQFVDDPSIADAIGKLYGVNIKIIITDAEQ